MKTREFAEVARLGATAFACHAWQAPIQGRIVALTNPRYAAWIRTSDGDLHYTDCTWITRIEVEK